MIQKLNDNKVPPTHITQLSGQRNMQSVNNYSSVSKEQQKNISWYWAQSLQHAIPRATQTTMLHALLNHHFDDRSGGLVHKNLDGSCSWSRQWSRTPWWTIQHEVIYISRTVISHLPVLELNVATRRWFDRIKKRQKRVSQSDNKLIIWTCLCPLAGCKQFNYVLP